jgi:hypothetical protein
MTVPATDLWCVLASIIESASKFVVRSSRPNSLLADFDRQKHLSTIPYVQGEVIA